MIGLQDPDRAFALGHMLPKYRENVAALWALDEQLGQIVATTTQPMVGMMRLMWWREAIVAGTDGHPVLSALASVLARDVEPDALGKIVDGWEEVLEPLPLTEAQLETFAERRGDTLFAMTARLCGVTCPAGAGAGWALVDFGLRCSDVVTSSRALDLARAKLFEVQLATMPRALRILVRLARRDVAAGKRTERTPWALLRSVA